MLLLLIYIVGLTGFVQKYVHTPFSQIIYKKNPDFEAPASNTVADSL